MSFTSEEVFSNLPEVLKPKAETVFAMGQLEQIPALGEQDYNDWELITAMRSEVQKAIEPLRKSREVGHSLDTHIIIYAPDSVLEALDRQAPDLPGMLIVSQASLEKSDAKPEGIYLSEEVENLGVEVQKAKGEKCARCWKYDENLGQDADHPDVCPRCAQVLNQV